MINYTSETITIKVKGNHRWFVLQMVTSENIIVFSFTSLYRKNMTSVSREHTHSSARTPDTPGRGVGNVPGPSQPSAVQHPNAGSDPVCSCSVARPGSVVDSDCLYSIIQIRPVRRGNSSLLLPNFETILEG